MKTTNAVELMMNAGTYEALNRLEELIKGAELPQASEKALFKGVSDLYEGMSQLVKDAQSTWQPIDTAPKDGTRVLVYASAHRRHWFGTGYYFKGVPGGSEGWIAHSFCTTPKDDCSGSFEPTHWMPMLTPPETA